MYFSEPTDRAVLAFEDAQSKWEASEKTLTRLNKRRADSKGATSYLGKLWAKHVTLPSLETQIASAQKDMGRARERMIDRAEHALLMMGREAMANDADLRGQYAQMWDEYEQTRFFTRLGQRLAKAEAAVETALHAMAESDVYLKPGQTPRQIMSLAEARDTLYDANEEIIALQYHLNDRGGQNAEVNTLMDTAATLPDMKAAIDGLMDADPGASSLSSPEEVTRKGEMLREINAHIIRMQGYFGAQCAGAAARHDEQARNVQKAFLLDEVAKAVETVPAHKDLPKRLAQALGMGTSKAAARLKPRAARPGL